MNSLRLRQLVALVKTVNPTAGLVADLALTIFSGPSPVRMSRDLTKTLAWIEERVLSLMEQLAKPDISPAMSREVEIRLHETLDLLMDFKQERPWRG